MIIVIFAGGIFWGFSLGLATMVFLNTRRHRLQCEKARQTAGFAPRLEVDRASRARPQASDALGQLAIVP
jgi:hypothetical protein